MKRLRRPSMGFAFPEEELATRAAGEPHDRAALVVQVQDFEHANPLREQEHLVTDLDLLHPPRCAAAFSAIIIVVACGPRPSGTGTTDRSTTYNPVMPCTRHISSTTAAISSSGPMRQVPDMC